MTLSWFSLFFRHVFPSLFIESLHHLNCGRLWEIQSTLQGFGTLVFGFQCCSQPWRMSRGWVWPSVWGRSNHQERLCLLNSIIRTEGFSVCYKSFLVPYFSKHTVGKTNQVFRMPEVSNCPANPTWPLRAVLISHSLSEGPLWGPSHHQPMCKTGKTSTEENG